MKSEYKQITKFKSVEIGNRIRDEAKIRKCSRRDVFEIIYPNGEIKSENTVSQIYNATRPIYLNQIQLLADAWGVRIEYLLCKTHHKTSQEELLALHENFVSTDELLICLLEKRGHTIKTLNADNPYTISGNTDKEIILNGIALSPIDYINIIEDIYKHIDFIVANAEAYVERRKLCAGYEYSQIFNQK